MFEWYGANRLRNTFTGKCLSYVSGNGVDFVDCAKATKFETDVAAGTAAHRVRGRTLSVSPPVSLCLCCLLSWEDT